MIGLAVVLLLIAALFVFKMDFVMAYQESEKKIHLEGIQTPEQKATVETLKEQWLADFNRLLNQGENWNTSK